MNLQFQWPSTSYRNYWRQVTQPFLIIMTRSRKNSISSASDYSEGLKVDESEPLLTATYCKPRSIACQTDPLQWRTAQIEVIKKVLTDIVLDQSELLIPLSELINISQQTVYTKLGHIRGDLHYHKIHSTTYLRIVLALLLVLMIITGATAFYIHVYFAKLSEQSE